MCVKYRGRVLLTAPSHRQVEGILWREIRRLYRNARFPIGGDMHERAESGLQFSDDREIIGFATKEPERMAGFSGPNVLQLVDEASGVVDPIFDALEGNQAGGGTIVLISNPTQTSGAYYEACTAESSTYFRIHLTSIECAIEATKELGAGTGLATLEWCQEKLALWGEDDARYQVRVLGNFPTQSSDAMIALSVYEKAAARWRVEVPDAPLDVGVDVARFGTDSTSITWSRGDWASKATKLRGYDNVDVSDAVIEVVLDVAKRHEEVILKIDTTNQGGVADILRRANDRDDVKAAGIKIVVVDVQYAASALDPLRYERMRDQLWANLRDWMKDRGAICGDKDLKKDLLAPKFTYSLRNRLKVESKLEIRKRLGRSTDDADSLALAVWRPPRSKTDEMVFEDPTEFPKSKW